ncbi:MAG: ricin-type beta-trefoil lectin domain protein [Stappiaceae bacterium]
MRKFIQRSLAYSSACAALFVFWSVTAVAAPPELQTPAPVIYLADNLDEKDRLGWCIDTLGRGFSEDIQAHSCKPQGGDVQFSLDTDTGQLKSVAFDGKCVIKKETPNETVPFGLVDCAVDEPAQKFAYHQETMELRPSEDETLCVVVGESSRSAGPFMSRSLVLAACAKTEVELKQWIIKQ